MAAAASSTSIVGAVLSSLRFLLLTTVETHLQNCERSARTPTQGEVFHVGVRLSDDCTDGFRFRFKEPWGPVQVGELRAVG